jgi:hypothetical protein
MKKRKADSKFTKDDLLKSIRSAYNDKVHVFYKSGVINIAELHNQDKENMIRLHLVAQRDGYHVVYVFYRDNSYHIEVFGRDEFIRVNNRSRQHLQDVKRWLTRTDDPIVKKRECAVCCRNVVPFVRDCNIFNMLYRVCGRCKILVCNVCMYKMILGGRLDCVCCQMRDAYLDHQSLPTFFKTFQDESTIYKAVAYRVITSVLQNKISYEEYHQFRNEFPEYCPHLDVIQDLCTVPLNRCCK